VFSKEVAEFLIKVPCNLLLKKEMLPGIYSEGEIARQIYLIRGRHVMLDRDLAKLYGVETRVLNQSVRRHIRRFPDDFMFQLSPEEFADWKSQIVISNSDVMGWRKPPLVFTELGIGMLSGVLNSDVAIDIHIFIMRAFQRMRATYLSHREVLDKLAHLEKSVEDLYGRDISREEMMLALSLQLEQFFEHGKRITIKGYQKK
jgi:hypothetical protein